MPRSSLLLSTLAVLALAGVTAPSQGAAKPLTRHAARPAWRQTVLHERVRRSGVYNVRVTITNRMRRKNVVHITIGRQSRHAATYRHPGHARVVRARVIVHGRTLTIRAIGRRGKPALSASLTRVRAGAKKHVAPNAPASPTPAPPVAAAPAPLPAAGSPFVLPAGFAATANYTTLAEDYEFSGPTLPADWSTGTSNYGYQATLYQPSQVSMTGSSVALTASVATSGGYPYQSGWITTAGKFTLTHGMIDFKAKMPAGQGLWSGLWAVNAHGSIPQGEIDVQEMLLGDTHTVNGSLHGWSPAPLWGETQFTTMAADASQDFHDYQVIWQPGMLTWALDGVAYAQYTAQQALASGHPWPFDTATGVYLIANLAVGAAAEWGGAPDAQTPFPASMQVQSVRVWQ